MRHFVFWYSRAEELQDSFGRRAASILRDPKEITRGHFTLVYEPAAGRNRVMERDSLVGALSGYVHCGETRDSRKRSDIEELFEAVVRAGEWPLNGSSTGSFAAVGYCSQSDQFVLCNDVLGYEPLFFCRLAGAVVGGSRLVDVGRLLGAQPDPVGVLQRLTPPYVNYGSRTILNDVKRLLPGQCLRFSESASKESVEFDNSLCSDVLTGRIRNVAEEVWSCFRSEASLACEGNERIIVALSGGWDSRHVLASMRHRQDLHCFTFGSPAHYEVQIARRCADAVGADFTACPTDGELFPPRTQLEALVRDTENANILKWIPLIKGAANSGLGNKTIMLGDMCETIQGRGMASISSRKARTRIFLKSLLGFEQPFLACTPDAFERWRQTQRDVLICSAKKSLRLLNPSLISGWTERSLLESSEADLDVSFSRVKSNLPPFAVMLDEVFKWFHGARLFMASQCLLLGAAFRPVCPAMGLQFMRLISCVPPGMRQQRRLLSAIAALPDFHKLADVPSAQIPWLGARAPLVARLAIWGMRSKTDQHLMRRVLRTQNLHARQRVLPSMDLIKEYRRESTIPSVCQWFSNRFVLGNAFVEEVRRRARLQSWPYENTDTASAANVSILLDLCAPS